MRVGTLEVDGPRGLLVAFALVTLVALVVAASTSTAAFGIYNPRWDGAAELRTIADDQGAESVIAGNVSAYHASLNEQSRSVAFVLSPDSAYRTRELGVIRGFVLNGGTLVVAEDYGPHSNQLLTKIGTRARVDGRPLRDDRTHYRSPAFPVAENVSSHELTRGIDSLTLNHGTAVEPNGATVLVTSSPYAYLDADGSETVSETEEVGSYPVVTVEPLGEGRVVVVGDPSVFINAMLERPGNRRFAANLLLSEDRVLIDLSHTAAPPPLLQLMLFLRDSSVAAAMLGLLGVGGILVWTRRPDLVNRVLDGRDPPVDGEPTGAVVAALLEERYPEITPDRVRRLVTAFKSSHPEEEGDG